MDAVTWFFVALFVTSALVFAGRFTVPGHGLSWPGTYEALVHIWVGVAGTLAVLWWGTLSGLACAVALVVLTGFETFMFMHAVNMKKFKFWKEGH